MKKAIVIGATSGIGRETAVRLVEEGWEVAFPAGGLRPLRLFGRNMVRESILSKWM